MVVEITRKKILGFILPEEIAMPGSLCPGCAGLPSLKVPRAALSPGSDTNSPGGPCHGPAVPLTPTTTSSTSIILGTAGACPAGKHLPKAWWSQGYLVTSQHLPQSLTSTSLLPLIPLLMSIAAGSSSVTSQEV